MELNHRFLVISQASLPLDHGTAASHEHAPKDSNPDKLIWNQPCCRYTRGVCHAAEAVGLEPTSDGLAACFRDRFLIQPDDFRSDCQVQRKARDSNPHHLAVARISNAARQTVSGYLPCRSGPTGNRTRISALPERRLPV